MQRQLDYTQWDSQRLLERVTILEKQLRDQTARLVFMLYPRTETTSDVLTRYEELAMITQTSSPSPKPRRTRSMRQFDPSKYSTRLIALKFAYLGQQYNGLEYHANNNTRYPTIEEEMWKALNKAKLIFPTPKVALKDGEPNWEGCEYSKSGRTDKGVSAFGQVIGIKVRSNKPLDEQETDVEAATERQVVKEDGSDHGLDDDALASHGGVFDPIRDEIPYPQILNRLLPPKIRVLAWCPSPPTDFSARFSCGERCYKYFFTQPAFISAIGQEGWLNIEAMREAARKFEGSHDFRNFCKVDPSKQIDNFMRVINGSDIVEIKSAEGRPAGYSKLSESLAPLTQASNETITDKVARPATQATPAAYAYKVRGSGFLWHQVRHMVAILFLIGQGLEKPSLVDQLLDIHSNPRKPTYDMAEAAPLVLEECNFPGAGLRWVHLGDYNGTEPGIRKSGAKGDGNDSLVAELWRVWHKHEIEETLAGSLLDVATRGYQGRTENDRSEEEPRNSGRNVDSQKVYQGGDAPRLVGKYIPILERPRMETVDAINAKYLKRKGLQPPERNGERSSVAE
ncbi:MAG: hypothetical protein Q9172_007108 [Xanthocarpia lactea]